MRQWKSSVSGMLRAEPSLITATQIQQSPTHHIQTRCLMLGGCGSFLWGIRASTITAPAGACSTQSCTQQINPATTSFLRPLSPFCQVLREEKMTPEPTVSSHWCTESSRPKSQRQLIEHNYFQWSYAHMHEADPISLPKSRPYYSLVGSA